MRDAVLGAYHVCKEAISGAWEEKGCADFMTFDGRSLCIGALEGKEGAGRCDMNSCAVRRRLRVPAPCFPRPHGTYSHCGRPLLCFLVHCAVPYSIEPLSVASHAFMQNTPTRLFRALNSQSEVKEQAQGPLVSLADRRIRSSDDPQIPTRGRQPMQALHASRCRNRGDQLHTYIPMYFDALMNRAIPAPLRPLH